MDLKRYMLAFVLLLALAALAACAEAEKQTNTQVLEFGDYIGVKIEDDSSSMDIAYDVKVTAGPSVNVYFMEDTDYADLVAGDDFAYYVVYSVLGTKDVQKDWTWSEKGTYYVVVYNVATSIENATVSYTVEWSETPAGTRIMWYVCGVLIVIGIPILIIVLRSRRRKKAEAAMAPIQPMAPTAAPGQYPPQGQYPPPAQYPPPPQGGTPPPTG